MIYKRQSPFSRLLLPILAILLLGGVYFGNYWYVSNNPGGTDFLTQWVGTKMLVVNEMNPYEAETSQAIQQQANIQGVNANKGDLQFHYPLYSVVIFSIFALIPDYLTARAIWMVFLEISLILFCWLSLKLFETKSRPSIKYIFLLVMGLGFHSIYPVINGDVIILIGLLLVVSLLMVKNGGDEIAGVLVAFTTIKGQPLILFYLFLLIWIFRNQRWNILVWFLITIVMLSASSALFIPRWILDNIGMVFQSPSFAPYSTPGQALAELWFPQFGVRIGWILSVIVMVILLFEWRNPQSDDFGVFAWLSALSLAGSQWIGISSEPSNYILLYPGLALVFSNIAGRWNERSLIYFIIAFGLLSLGIWSFFQRTLAFYQLNQALHPGLIFILPIFSFLGLFWIRWWMLHPGKGLENNSYG